MEIYFLIWVGWALVLWLASRNKPLIAMPLTFLPQVTKPQRAVIQVGGECGRRIAEGQGYVVSVVIFYPGDEELSFMVPDNLETEEAVAILRKYKVPL